MSSTENQSTEGIGVLKLTEATLRANQLAEMLESSTQAFALHYTDARVSIFNDAFAKLIGHSWDELKALDWELLTPINWVKHSQEMLAELNRTGIPVRYEKEYFHKSGRRIPVEVYVNLHHDHLGQADYYFAFVTDITIRKRARNCVNTLSESSSTTFVGRSVQPSNSQGCFGMEQP